MKEVGDGIFIETGLEGVNVGAVRTEEGIVCIDAPSYPRDAREWVHRLERMLGQPIRLLILTDDHGDRILNTRWFSAPVIAHRLAAKSIFSYEKRYPQELIESLQRRNPRAGRELTHSPVNRPSLSFTNSLSLNLEPYTFDLTYRPGPSPASTWIKILEEDILFVGDSLVAGTLPVFNYFRWQEWLDSLTLLASEQSSYKVIVPGRGEDFDFDVINKMIGYLETLKQAVITYVNEEPSPVRLHQIASELVDRFPVDSYPRDWLVSELAIGLERLRVELVFNKNGA